MSFRRVGFGRITRRRVDKGGDCFRSGLGLEEGENLSVVGEAPASCLREDQLAVYDDVEDARATL